MCEALMEIMQPQLLQREKECRIQGTVEAMKELGHDDDEIRTMIIRKYNLSENEAEVYL